MLFFDSKKEEIHILIKLMANYEILGSVVLPNQNARKSWNVLFLNVSASNILLGMAKNETTNQKKFWFFSAFFMNKTTVSFGITVIKQTDVKNLSDVKIVIKLAGRGSYVQQQLPLPGFM